MNRDAFSRYHPIVNLLFFLGAIGFGVVIQHPAYMLAGCIAGGIYYTMLHRDNGLKVILGMLPVAIMIAVINPLFNTYGDRVLFHVFGRPYTLEALFYGMVIAGMFISMMLWFGCYNAVLTSDKFTSLFGNLIPAISLLLVMILRMIPNFIRKIQQISGCRKSIGKGVSEQNSNKEKLLDGMTILSALTDWALEGSVVTGDSMRARGYGCAKRTSFQIYRMTMRDWVLTAMIVLLFFSVIFAGGTAATFTPHMYIPTLSWGFGAYCIFVSIPIVLHISEELQWHYLISKI